MTKKAFAAALLLALLPASALAQSTPPRIVVPNGASTPGGLTVSGHGTARRRADGLRFTANLPLQNGTRNLAAADELVAALKANGVADAQVQPPGPYIGPGNGLIVTGSLRNPSDARLRDLVAKVGAAAPALLIQNLSYATYLDDCSGDEQRAIDAAFADAQGRAARVAAAAHLAVGEVVAMNVYTASAGCASKPAGLASLNGPGSRDGSAPTDVVVEANMSVTFAIGPAEGGARRRPL